MDYQALQGRTFEKELTPDSGQSRQRHLGRVFRATTDFFVGGGDRYAQLRKMHTACKPGPGGKKVSIKVFDKKGLVGNVTSSIVGVKQTLETFFNNLHATQNLDPAVAQNLQTFTFEVEFFARNSSAAERLAFGKMDFPVYLDSSAGIAPLTQKDGDDFIRNHKLPQLTKVTIKLPTGNEFERTVLKTYEAIESFIKDEDQKVPGIGIPGPYFTPGSQDKCRKIGIIKMNLVENAVPALREQKFIVVLKHELGHMFGMDHEAGTMMDRTYGDSLQHSNYTPRQIRVLSDSLTVLSQ